MAELTAEAIRTARETAGWSVAEAARELKRRSGQPLPALDSVVRSWKRWEQGTQPNRFYQPLLAGLLAMTDNSSASDAVAVNLTGDWWAAWQSSRDRHAVLAVQPVRFRQHGDTVRMRALRRGRPVVEGGYLWNGELRIWDNEVLMGWYAADDGSVRSKGTVYLVLHPQGQRMTGRWVGLSWDGDTVTGLAAMARSEDEVNVTIRNLIDEETGGADR